MRRLSAILPANPLQSEKVAARLRLSNKARKRLACTADRDLSESPRALAYWVGVQCAVDRLLLANKAADAQAIADWHPPRLPVGGARLMALGLLEGPIIARTLQAIERTWVEEGFPTGKDLESIVAAKVAAAR